MPLQQNTPVEDHLEQFDLLVKREDLSCVPPGPPFSKTRGVYAHIAARPEKVIGVLDTYHSQAGHAVAEACRLLGKECVNFWPVRKAELGASIKPQQLAAKDLGAQLVALPAGRSAILYHQAKKRLADWGDSYMMPNALKLPEMITETAAEVRATLRSTPLPPRMPVLIAASSGTIAAGVMRGFCDAGEGNRPFLIHQGYDRSESVILEYMVKMSELNLDAHSIRLINEGYSYGDKSKIVYDLPFPANHYYDMKAFHWWMKEGRNQYGQALFWLIG